MAAAGRPLLKATHSSMYDSVASFYEQHIPQWLDLSQKIEQLYNESRRLISTAELELEDQSKQARLQTIIPKYYELQKQERLFWYEFKSHCLSFLTETKKGIIPPSPLPKEPTAPLFQQGPSALPAVILHKAQDVVYGQDPEFETLRTKTKKGVNDLLDKAEKIINQRIVTLWDQTKTLLEEALREANAPLPPETRISTPSLPGLGKLSFSIPKETPILGATAAYIRETLPKRFGGTWVRLQFAIDRYEESLHNNGQLQQLKLPAISLSEPQEQIGENATSVDREEAMRALAAVWTRINDLLLAPVESVVAPRESDD